MKLVSAEFVTSVAAGGEVPVGDLPVMALVGRSNVGKSNLINALVKHPIARSGAKPGTTRLLNVYRVSTPPHGMQPFFFIDLPGYGYARGGRNARQTFDALTSSFFDQVYVSGRCAGTRGIMMAGVLLVVDVRHAGLKSDVAALDWALEHKYPLVTVATKADRVSRAVRKHAHRTHKEALGNPKVPLVVVSTRTGEGIGQVWTELRELLRVL